MQTTEYHKRIIDYYKSTEDAYKDSWDLTHSLAIHYGYRDKTVHTFRQSLQKMNEVMAAAAKIKAGERVLDAGCGVGGGSIFLASNVGANVTGISLSERQVLLAKENANRRNLDDKVEFEVMNYCATRFADSSFDIVWGCESICYADNKEQFIRESYRLLKPGGRLVIADGFVTKFDNNEHPVIRKWLDGWQVNYLETPERFENFMIDTGFTGIEYRDITSNIMSSGKRLYLFYFLARLYLIMKTLSFSNKATTLQKMNINACKYQWLGLKKGLWKYGLIVGTKTAN